MIPMSFSPLSGHHPLSASAIVNNNHWHRSTTIPGLNHILQLHHRYYKPSATPLSTSYPFSSTDPSFMNLPDTCPKTVSTVGLRWPLLAELVNPKGWGLGRLGGISNYMSVDIWEHNKELIRKRTDIGEHFTREVIQSYRIYIFTTRRKSASD